MKLPSLLKTKEASSSWPWPTCGSPRTISFRAGNDIFKTINSAFIDSSNTLQCKESRTLDRPFLNSANVESVIEVAGTPERWFTKSSESTSFSVASEDPFGEPIETVIRGLRSERLFFEPGETSSIMEEAKTDGFLFKESVVMAVDSWDPFVDFKRSMEEMVEAHGLKEWECLEELLSWYLRVNEESNHGYIVGAFVDLLVSLSFVSSSCFDDHCSSITHSFTSPLSFSSSTSTSPCLSSLEAEDEIEKTVDNASSSDV
ncbi:unnamed protein product [Ilex paraguariensis]|uniref:Transcription repressor n=1 Tax=Ilex paraguariensis TaxID=185542 RepID=A0ABC8UHR3_9AQUA